jgi:hypothetical protein
MARYGMGRGGFRAASSFAIVSPKQRVSSIMLIMLCFSGAPGGAGLFVFIACK